MCSIVSGERWFCFVDIVEIIDHHCSNSLFITCLSNTGKGKICKAAFASLRIRADTKCSDMLYEKHIHV
jgi:hypothetical protein